MKKVSVIIPIYNSEVVLKKAIKSVLNQTYKNIQLILVNDGSSDNSLNIIKRLTVDPKNKLEVIVIDKEKNEGVDAARFSGLEKATGNYILFLDSDDWYEKRAIENLVRLKEKNNVDIVYSNFKRVYSTKLFLSKKGQLMPSLVNKKFTDEEKEELLISFFGVNKLPVNLWANLFDSKLFNEPLQKSGLKFGEDLLLSLQLFLRAKSIFVADKIVYNYRWGGVTARFQPDFILSCRYLFEKKLKYCANLTSPKIRQYTIIEMKNCLGSFITMLLTYFPKEKEDNLETIRDEINWEGYNVFSEILTDENNFRNNFIKAVLSKDAEKVYNLFVPKVSNFRARIRQGLKLFANKFLSRIPV